MDEKTEGILETKLDILIQDFQRFRKDQILVNKETKQHASEENEVQAKILTTLNWHTVIGSFMILVICGIVLGKL